MKILVNNQLAAKDITIKEMEDFITCYAKLGLYDITIITNSGKYHLNFSEGLKAQLEEIRKNEINGKEMPILQ